ncbi:hypothetical protein ACRRTK_004395 [Alexandromys fortis]
MHGHPDTGIKVALALWGWCGLPSIPHLLPSPVYLTLAPTSKEGGPESKGAGTTM